MTILHLFHALRSGGMVGAKPLADRRVLIAEDELLIAMELQMLVEGLAGSVVGLVNAVPKIVDAATRLSPDLVLLDVNMRGQMTYEAAAHLKREGIPVLFVTGYDTPPDCPESLRDVPCVRKPVTVPDMAKAIARL